MKILPHTSNILLRTCLIAWLSAIWIGSLIPVSGPSVPNGDKIEHFIAYGVLALLAQLMWRRPLQVWLCASLMGVAVECAQGLTTWRAFDPLDMLANSIGAICGVLLAYLYLRTRQQR